MGAVDGGGCATGIPRVTGTIDKRLKGRFQVRFGTFCGDIGNLTGFGQGNVGVFVVLLNKGGVRDFTRHDVSTVAKDGVGSLRSEKAQWIDVQRGAL